MKYLSEYRDPEMVQEYLKEIHKITTKPWTLMEICGGQTHSLVKNGLLDLLPEKITMVHGPGCPVCVTPVSVIDEAVYLSMLPTNTVFIWRYASCAWVKEKFVRSQSRRR